MTLSPPPPPSGGQSKCRRQLWAEASSKGGQNDSKGRGESMRSSMRNMSNALVSSSGDMKSSLKRAINMSNELGSTRSLRSAECRASNSSFRSSRRLFSEQAAGASSTGDPDEFAKAMKSPLAICLACNFISMGYLFVPWAFATAGLLLTTVVFLIVMLQSFVTCTYVMEACARAEFLASKDPIELMSLADKNGNENLLETTERSGHVIEDSSTRLEDRDGLLIEDSSVRKEDRDGLFIECSSVRKEDRDGLLIEDPSVRNEGRDVDNNSSKDPRVVTDSAYGDLISDENDEEAMSNKKPHEAPAPGSTTEVTGDSVDNKWWHKTAYSKGTVTRAETSAQERRSGGLPMIGDRTFELPELSRIFMGEIWRIIFTITTCCDLYGITWSVAAVFASSLASDFSIRENEDDYVIFILIFAVIAIPMSFLAIVDQIYVQMVFFVTRMVMVVTMLITTAVAFRSNDSHFGDIEGRQAIPIANFRSLHLAIQVCFFATAYQFSVPIMAEAAEHKSSVRNIYGGSTGIIAGSVLLLSLVLSSYFGSEFMEPSSNLNWAAYHGGTGTIDSETGERVEVALWASVISNFVLIFPAIDGISTFVLCSVSLGSILLGAWYGKDVHDLGDSWKRRILFCVLGSFPQLVGAAFVRDLSMIATYAGLFTVASYTICPCLLQISSARLLRQANVDPKTHYSTIFSGELWAWTIAFLGVFSMLYAIIGSQVIES